MTCQGCIQAIEDNILQGSRICLSIAGFKTLEDETYVECEDSTSEDARYMEFLCNFILEALHR